MRLDVALVSDSLLPEARNGVTYGAVDTADSNNAQLALDLAVLGHPSPLALDPGDREGLGQLGRRRASRDSLTQDIRQEKQVLQARDHASDMAT